MLLSVNFNVLETTLNCVVVSCYVNNFVDNEEKMSDLRLSDSVWHRVVQIVQEAMLTGVDCADLLRQVRVVGDVEDPSCLVLSPEYQKQVREMHEKMLQRVREEQSTHQKFIIPGGSGADN